MWKKFIKALKRHGYTGAEDDVSAIKAFAAEKGIEYATADGPIDIDAEYELSKKTPTTKTVRIDEDEDDEEDDKPARKKVKNTAGADDSDEDDGDEDEEAPATKSLARVNAQVMQLEKRLQRLTTGKAAAPVLRAAAMLTMGGGWRHAVMLTAPRTTYQPDIAVIEKVFVNTNPQSTLLLGQARGAAE